MTLERRIRALEEDSRDRAALAAPESPSAVEIVERINQVVNFTQGAMKIPQLLPAWERVLRAVAARPVSSGDEGYALLLDEAKKADAGLPDEAEENEPAVEAEIRAAFDEFWPALAAAVAEKNENATRGHWLCNGLEAMRFAGGDGPLPALPRCERCGIYHGSPSGRI